MKLRLYNTLTKREEEFAPLDPAGRNVTFYSCGPTVYDFAHIGNFRSFLNADVLRRTLELLGYHVRHVMNITDVGHMTDDAAADGLGEDKMQVAARRLREAKKSGALPGTQFQVNQEWGALPHVRDVDPSDPYAVAEFYARAFLRDARILGLKVALEAQARPELMPRPTQYIPQMIAMVQTLIARRHAYVGADGAVYFDVQSYPEYGRLSGNTPDAIRSGEGGRVDAATQALKKHPADFMLWKPDPSHVMKWESPWGEGYPGWHLECSVMAQSLLGDQIDLHSGGEDNIFPHHECEIAQSCCATGRQTFARWWFHTRFLIVEGEKMSKSRGNFFTLGDLLSRGASPAAIRLELIKTHYRSNANFTFQGLQDSQRMIERWARLQGQLEQGTGGARATRHESALEGPLAQALPAFKAALSADLNIAGAIGALNEAAGMYTRQDHVSAGLNAHAELQALAQMSSVLGVLDLEREGRAAIGEDESSRVNALLADRVAARQRKDFKRADAIRDELLAMGIEIKDSQQGTTWSRVMK